MNPDEQRIRRNKLVAIGLTAAIIIVPLGVIGILATITKDDNSTKTSNTTNYDPINGDALFNDPNQTPESADGNAGVFVLRDVEQLYQLVKSSEFTTIRTTLDAYVKSKLGKSYDQVGYIDKGEATKTSGAISFTMNVQPSGLSVPVLVTVTDYGKVLVYFDNASTPFDVTAQGASIQNTSSDPLLSRLPYTTKHFKMSTRTTTRGDTVKISVDVSLAAVNSKPGLRDIYLNDLNTYYEEALAFIRSTGADPNNYDLYFDPDPANPFQEYDAH